MDQTHFLIADDWLAEPFAPSAEIALVIAIIEDAIHCATHPGEYTTEAREWIECDDPSDWIFTFESCCELLRLAIAPARRRIMDMAGYTLPPPIIAPSGSYYRRKRDRRQLLLL